MDTDLLKTFLEIHKTRHFGKAADNLFITQSAVSARIRQLEVELGVKLFERDRNNIRPTPMGEKLVLHAENILNMWNRARIEIAIEDEDLTPLSIGAVSSLWDIYLNKWLTKVVWEQKNITLTCNALSTELINQRIKNNTLDIGFTYNPPIDENIKILKVIPVRFVMVSSEKEQDVDSAIKDRYIYVDWGTSFSAAHSEHFQNIPLPLMRTDLGRTAKTYIKKNGGTAYLTESMIKRDINNQVLFLVKNAPVIERSAYFISNKKNDNFETISKLMPV